MIPLGILASSIRTVNTTSPVEFVGATFSGYFNGVTSVSAMTPPETQVGDLIIGIVGHRSTLTGGVTDWTVESTVSGPQRQSVMTRYADQAGSYQVGVAQGSSGRIWLGVLVFRAGGRAVAVGAIQTGLASPPVGGSSPLPVLPVINLTGSDAPFVVSAASSTYTRIVSNTVFRPIAEAFRVLDTGSSSPSNSARFAVGVIQRPPSDELGVAFEMTGIGEGYPDTVPVHTFEVI